MLKTYTFQSGFRGPNILILGLIHGNEPCGKIAIHQFIEKLNTKEITIIKGNITFIPICNPEAHLRNIRYKDENLNRIFQKYDTPTSYEQRLANEITSFVHECDYLLDIHSTTQDTPAFVFQDFDDLETRDLALSLKTSYIVSGWQDIYSDSEVGDTVSFAYEKGKKGLLVECGQHISESSVSIAYKSIIFFLENLGIIPSKNSKITESSTRVIHIVKVYFKEFTGNFQKKWINFDKVKKGEIIGTYDNGEAIKAEAYGYIIMPNDNVKIGEDWFYFGIENNI